MRRVTKHSAIMVNSEDFLRIADSLGQRQKGCCRSIGNAKAIIVFRESDTELLFDVCCIGGWRVASFLCFMNLLSGANDL